MQDRVTEHYAWANRFLELALGNNPHGRPLYRFVWGPDRLEWVGGKYSDWDENTGSLIREVVEQRQIPKYSHLGVEHFFVERWYPAEHFGSKENWESKTVEREDGISIPALGPYPAEGDYDYAWTMEGPNGEYRDLTFARVEWIIGVIIDCEKKNAFARAVAQKAFAELRKQMQKELDLRILEEATPAFHGKLRRGSAIALTN
jgi:hypothetical protein